MALLANKAATTRIMVSLRSFPLLATFLLAFVGAEDYNAVDDYNVEYNDEYQYQNYNYDDGQYQNYDNNDYQNYNYDNNNYNYDEEENNQDDAEQAYYYNNIYSNSDFSAGDDTITYWTDYAILPKRCIV